MIRKFKGIIRNKMLSRILTSSEPQKRVIAHTMEKGMHKITTSKSKFEIVPVSVEYWHVYQIMGE